MALFDLHIVVDWSANSTPKTGADSIWIAVHGAEELSLSNPATRTAAMAELSDLLDHATRQGQRVLLGFDFAFGYPRGATARLTAGGDWRALWAKIADLITDDARNANNRFAAAAKLNSAFSDSGEGPFWGHPHQHMGRYPGLGPKKPAGYGTKLPPSKRHAETLATGAQEVWKLIGVGSVGSQALMGIAHLERLCQMHPIAVWPFEETTPAKPHLVAEVFPSLLPADPREDVRDAGQVRALAAALARLDSQGTLAPLIEAPKAYPSYVSEEEGSILGLSHQAELRAALDLCTTSRSMQPVAQPEVQA